MRYCKPKLNDIERTLQACVTGSGAPGPAPSVVECSGGGSAAGGTCVGGTGASYTECLAGVSVGSLTSATRVAPQSSAFPKHVGATGNRRSSKHAARSTMPIGSRHAHLIGEII